MKWIRASFASGLLVGLVAGCRDVVTAPDVEPSFLYSDEFYGHSTSCDPPGSPKCKPMMLTTSQHVAVDNVINAMTGCKEMQAYARQLLDDGSIWYYMADDGNWADSHWPNLDQIHVWDGTFQSTELPATIAHEVAHIFLETTSEFLPNAMETNCF